METPIHITAALYAQNVVLHALAATHPDPARLLRAFEKFAADAEARHAENAELSGALLALLDATRVVLNARPIP